MSLIFLVNDCNNWNYIEFINTPNADACNKKRTINIYSNKETSKTLYKNFTYLFIKKSKFYNYKKYFFDQTIICEISIISGSFNVTRLIGLISHRLNLIKSQFTINPFPI